MVRNKKTEEEKAERQRRWHNNYVAKNREHVRAYLQEYYAKNKDGSIKEYREKNSEKRLAYQRDYYQKHKKECHERVKAWRAKKREEREKGKQNG